MSRLHPTHTNRRDLARRRYCHKGMAVAVSILALTALPSLSASAQLAHTGGARGHLPQARLQSALLHTVRRSGPTVENGPKLTVADQRAMGSNSLYGSSAGYAVALSADGRTALLGGPSDNYPDETGAVWVFTHSGSSWGQQGGKLTGGGEIGGAQFGQTLALSANGDTALIGGPEDNNGVGAAWVFTRSGSTWTHQGPKLTGRGETNTVDDSGNGGLFGASVALSADGNTAVIGGSNDNDGVGAVWTFTRTGSSWTQTGQKLVSPAKGVAQSGFGTSLAVSADGKTTVVGAPGGNAAFAFIRSGSVWKQQGVELNGGKGATGTFGISVALSSDGNTGLVGSYVNTPTGGAYVFARSHGTWSHQGPELVPSNTSDDDPFFGESVALSASGNTAIVGSPLLNYGDGQAWAYSRTGTTWTAAGAKLPAAGEIGTGCVFGCSYHESGSFGRSAALAADGSALIGGPNDNSGAGAAWVFTIPEKSTTPKGPMVSAGSLTGVAKGTPHLSFTLAAAPGTKVASFEIQLPKQLSFSGGKQAIAKDVTAAGPKGTAISFTGTDTSQSLTVKLAQAQARLHTTVLSPLLVASKALTTEVKNGKAGPLTIQVVVTEKGLKPVTVPLQVTPN